MYSIPKTNPSQTKVIVQSKSISHFGGQSRDPKYRFCHSTCYISPLNAILLFGGFDHGYNYDDSRLLFLNDMTWYDIEYAVTLENPNNIPHWSALHTMVSNIILSDKDNDKDNDIDIDPIRNELEKQEKAKLDNINISADGTGGAELFDDNQCYHRLSRNKVDVYLFGGQYHDGGPYSYLNHLWRYTFYDAYDKKGGKNSNNNNNNDEQKTSTINHLNSGFIEMHKIPFSGTNSDADIPCARSQTYCWISDNKLFSYGGITADRKTGKTLNDLYFLDLKTYKWNKIEYGGIIPPPSYQAFEVTPGRIFNGRPIAYYDHLYRKLIVVHFDNDSSYNTINNSKNKHKNKKKKKDERFPVYGKNGCVVFILDLKTNEWKFLDKYNKPNSKNSKSNSLTNIFKSGKSSKNKNKDSSNDNNNNNNYGSVSKSHPPKLRGTRVARIGDLLVFIGGHYEVKRASDSNQVWCLKIPTCGASWEHERLVWIGYLKEKEKGPCPFAKLPKDVIRHLAKFFS